MGFRNVFLLALSQALGSSGVSMVVLLGGILGAQLAPSPTLATVPASVMVIGVALTTIPASLLMQRIGRRPGFIGAALAASLAALLAAYAVMQASFTLLCLSTFLIGATGAFMQQYRFAAAESVAPERAARAISFMLLGGIVAGFLGPELGRRASDWLPSVQYSGSFVSMAGLFILAAVTLSFLREPAPLQVDTSLAGRPVFQIASQPIYLLAVLASGVGYGVMSFVMTATPVYMHQMHGFSLDQTALVIQSHIIAMYLPSLFTGVLLEKLGLQRMLLLGVAALAACVGLGVISREFVHFWGALVLLGVGWNFLFVGGTVLLTSSYHPQERFKAQGLNDFLVLGVQAFTSLSAGTVLFNANWSTLNLLNLPALALVLAVVLRLRRQIA